jgi:hypothetical protein
LNNIMPRWRGVASPDRLHGLCRMGAAEAGYATYEDTTGTQHIR